MFKIKLAKSVEAKFLPEGIPAVLNPTLSGSNYTISYRIFSKNYIKAFVVWSLSSKNFERVEYHWNGKYWKFINKST